MSAIRGVNHDFLKDQYGLWPRLVRLPLLIYDVIEYNRPSGADDQTNRTLRQRAHKLHWNLDLSSLKRSSLESLQLELHDPNAGSIARTYSVIAATNYVCILTATSILIDRLVKFRGTKYYLATGELLWPDGQLSTEESALRYLLGASYAWWKAPSPAFAHSKHADIMWSASFKTVAAIDDQGTWEEITNGPGESDSQDFYDQIALFRQCSYLPVGLPMTY